MSEQYPEPDPRLAQSETIQRLREGPAPATELQPSNEQRQYIRKLRIPRSAPASDYGGGNGQKMVYYLYGDERRAMRCLIELRPDFFRDVLGGETRHLTVLTGSWGDALVQLAVEEYTFHDAQARGEPES